MDCKLPGSSAHGIFQTRILEWVAISSFRGSSWPSDWTCICCTAGGFFTARAIGEALIPALERHMYLWLLISSREATSFLENVSKLTFCFCCSVVKLCPTLCDPMNCNTPGFPVLHYLPEFAQTQVHWVSDALQSSRPLLPVCPLAFNLSQDQGLFQWVSSLHQVAKVLQLQFQHLSNEYSGLISFRMDPFDLLAVQRTLKSLLQHHSLKASVLQHLAFYMVQLSHPYMTTGKTIALTLRTFVVKVISLLSLINLF